jgi:RNA polymerase sigma-70 factor (ECF subfamily)
VSERSRDDSWEVAASRHCGTGDAPPVTIIAEADIDVNMNHRKKLRSADAERFQRVFDATHPQVLAYVRRRVWDPHDVVDVVADVYVVAWRRIADVPAGDEALLWLIGTARLSVANLRRGMLRRKKLGEKLASVLVDRTVEPAFDDGGEGVRTALAGLSEDDRDILLMVAADGLTPAEIALVLHLSSDATRARLSRARTRLRTALLSQQAASGHDVNARLDEARKQ